MWKNIYTHHVLSASACHALALYSAGTVARQIYIIGAFKQVAEKPARENVIITVTEWLHFFNVHETRKYVV